MRTWLGEAAFADWGWRIPFLISILLLAVSLWIRMKLEESPVFAEMKAAGEGSKAPLTEAFARWGNARIVLIALVGAVAGQAVVWYTGQFYALFFLEKTLKVDGATANILIAIALALATPFFIFFGWLSDKIGRKPIIMAGCALAALTYFPLFGALTDGRQSGAGAGAGERAGDGPRRPRDLLGPVRSDRQDQVRPQRLRHRQVDAGQGGDQLCQCGRRRGRGDRSARRRVAVGDTRAPTARGLTRGRDRGGLSRQGRSRRRSTGRCVVGILFLLALYVTMVYGPIAALLVELFPTRIRYTSMSLPYHIGNGWFGGFLPTTAFAMVAATGNIYYGLWYPIVVALVTLVAGMLFLPETFRNRL